MFTNFLFFINKIFLVIYDYPKKYFLILLFILTILSSFSEIATIASLVPLMNLLLDINSNFINNYYFKTFIDFFNVNNYKIFFFLFFAFLIIFSFFLKIALIILTIYISHDMSFFIHNKVFAKIINQNYKYFTLSNTSVFLGNLEKVEILRSAVFSLIQLFTSMIIACSIIFLIFYINFFLTLAFILFFFIVYFFFFFLTKKILTKISYLQAIIINSRYQLLLECSDNIKEIIIRNLNKFFSNKYYEIMKIIKKSRIQSETITNFSNQIAIMFATLFLLGVVLYYYYYQSSLLFNVSLLAAFFLSVQKLIPQAQNIYASLGVIKIQYSSVNDVINVLNLQNDRKEIQKKYSSNKIILNSSFEIKELSFKYKEEDDYLFINSNLNFQVNKIYALYGDSGVGKSSFLDILMGLTKESNGQFFVDKKEIKLFSNAKWQDLICYVPQNTILVDSTIMENICYGYDLENIDINMLKECAKDAECLEFIENSKDGFDTKIGERGIRISGGQRQRLSIAKALYSNRPVLILDEATNAIDKDTELKIYNNLKKKLNGRIIISVTHNKSLEKYYNHIYEIRNKKIILLS